jgi:hypothetical protein
MMVKTSLVVVALTCAVACSAVPARADSLAATYFQILGTSGDPDFNIFNTPNVAPGSSLGVNGFPVATGGISDIAPTGEITWWSPSLNSNVAQTGTDTITLPYSSNMFAPNSTGANDGTYFETAFFKGILNVPSAETVTFSLGSDDDTFVYVNGKLVGQNPGVHGVTDTSFTTPVLNAGANSVEVFYADRHQTGAFLSLSFTTEGVTITTDPAPGPIPGAGLLSYVALGLMGLGSMGWKRYVQSQRS